MIIAVVVLSLLLSSTPAAGYLDNYNCGVGKVSKTLSYLTSYSCGIDLVNQCCFTHDVCYEWNKWTPFIVSCDEVFSDCTYQSYMDNNQPFCANLIYLTHGKLMESFGSFFRNINGYGFGK